MASLHKLERELLLALKKKRTLSLEELVEGTGLTEDAVMRAASWLVAKKLANMMEERRTFAQLGSEGDKFLREGLPERRLVKAVLKLGNRTSFDEALKVTGLTKEEGSIAVGWAKRKGWLRAWKEREKLMLEADKEPEYGVDEKLILKLGEGRLALDECPKQLVKGLEFLKSRPNVIIASEEVERSVTLTSEGIRAAQQIKVIAREVSQLTPELIRTGLWRGFGLRRFDVKVPGPTIYPAKIQPAEQIIKQVREIFLEMGFAEIRGPLIETAFWNFDALFQPQDHPAREMMDTFYIAKPSTGKLPSDNIVKKVGRTHENGWITGSTGWGYKWKKEEAKRLLLRTHTTAETIRYLAEHKEPPVKVFSVDRVYRNEKVDYKHLAEFHQIEGIVMDENVTLRDLMGVLREFYAKLGLEKVQFWPSYFPYTEPSVQTTVYVPELKAWVELCGMGIFRPEVTLPLGVKYPVLAWGGGLERVIMLKLGVEDIRELYRNDLGWIRRIPVCQR